MELAKWPCPFEKEMQRIIPCKANPAMQLNGVSRDFEKRIRRIGFSD